MKRKDRNTAAYDGRASLSCMRDTSSYRATDSTSSMGQMRPYSSQPCSITSGSDLWGSNMMLLGVTIITPPTTPWEMTETGGAFPVNSSRPLLSCYCAQDFLNRNQDWYSGKWTRAESFGIWSKAKQWRKAWNMCTLFSVMSLTLEKLPTMPSVKYLQLILRNLTGLSSSEGGESSRCLGLHLDLSS